MQKIASIIALLLISTSLAFADDDYLSARKYVEVIVNELIIEVKANQDVYAEDQQRLFTLIEAKVLPSVDIELFSKLSLGKYWKSASTAQRKLFTASLRKTLTRSYGKALVLLSEVDRVEFAPADTQSKGKKYKRIASKMIFTGGEKPISISYAVRKEDDKWLIFDLVIDGVSIVKQFRQNFNREISEKGLNALINRIQQQSSSN